MSRRAASAANPYLIWVGPGVYDEVVTTTAGADFAALGWLHEQ